MQPFCSRTKKTEPLLSPPRFASSQLSKPIGSARLPVLELAVLAGVFVYGRLAGVFDDRKLPKNCFAGARALSGDSNEEAEVDGGGVSGIGSTASIGAAYRSNFLLLIGGPPP